MLADSVSDIIFAGAEDFREAPSAGREAGETARISSLVTQDDRLIAILNLKALFPWGVPAPF